jgi:hypothetical protein
MAVLDGRGGGTTTESGDGGAIVPIKVGPPPTPTGRVLSVGFGIAAVVTGIARYPGATLGFAAVSAVLNAWDLIMNRPVGEAADRAAARNAASRSQQ